MRSEPAFALAVQYASRSEAPSRAQVRRWIRTTLALADAPNRCEFLVRFVDRVEGRALNSMFRKRDYATNVLTFPYDEAPAGTHGGDIVICSPVVEAEARTQRKILGHHYAHMTIHGTLHAIGFDHEGTAEALAMETLETRILQRFRICDPYA